MRTAIITDSNSGIFQAEAEQLGIYTVSMPVILDGKTYYEGTTLRHETLYRLLEDGATVSTSQPAPADVAKTWERAFLDGYDEMVYIPMSSGLSSSLQTAKLLAEDYRGVVHVVDNHRISVTQRHAVLDAVQMAQKGNTGYCIKAHLEETAYLSLVYVGVQDLTYLKQGGRITAAAQTMGTLLKLKPLLVIQGDKLDAYAKVRGVRACQEKEIEAMQKYVQRIKAAGWAVRISASGSYANAAKATRWHNMVRAAFPGDEVTYDPLTCSIGCHVGPDAFGMGVSVCL